ncbi:MAG: pallilysin-related adhesin [Spirochaetaceae bacterium]
MKRLYLFFIFVLVFFLSCQEQNRNDNLEKKEIEINNMSEEILDELVLEEDDQSKNSIETFLDIESLFPGKIAVEKKDSNLDLDAADEQFIILIDELNLITVVVADFNKITRQYFVAWEIRLPLIYNSDFLMAEQDVLGFKHNYELIMSGTTITNNNALYIFKKTAPPKGIHIYYKTIFSYETTGTVELITKSRSLDYIESRKDSDKAYDVLVEKTNYIDENTIAIIKEKWVWDRRNNLYIQESSETTEQKINVKEKLTAILRGNKSDFKDFISGEWYLKDDKEEIQNIVIIDGKRDVVILQYKDGIEQYDITRTRRVYQQLKIFLKNSEVSTLPRQLVITLNSTDEINVKIADDIFWNGDYTRLNSDVKHSLLSNTNTDINKDVPFTGIYKNVLYSLNFSFPEYKKIHSENGTIEEGIFSLLELSNGEMIVQFKANSDIRSEFKITNYQLTYSEQQLDAQAIRTIKLHEGVLTTHGIEIKSDKDPLRFEQTEVMNNEQ